MPRIQPLSEQVSWPRDEGCIGVVGVAPWATIDFLKALYLRVAASKDWQYPRVICDINTKLPSRGRYFELGERDPSPFIAETVSELARQGATLAVVPCNTAHILYNRWAEKAPIPIPSIIDATVERVLDAGATNVSIFASPLVLRYQLYERALRASHVSVTPLGDEIIELISRAIAQVKVMSNMSDDLLKRMKRVVECLARQQVDAIILGCTELSGLGPLAQGLVTNIVDSNGALADAALRIATSSAC